MKDLKMFKKKIISFRWTLSNLYYNYRTLFLNSLGTGEEKFKFISSSFVITFSPVLPLWCMFFHNIFYTNLLLFTNWKNTYNLLVLNIVLKAKLKARLRKKNVNKFQTKGNKKFIKKTFLLWKQFKYKALTKL